MLTSSGLFNYSCFSGADSDQPWIYQGVPEQYSGWTFSTISSLIYMMPSLSIDMVGFNFITKTNLGKTANLSTIDSGGWGSDFIELTFGPMVNWKIDNRNSLRFSAFCRTDRKYTTETIYYNDFRNRKTTGKSYFYLASIMVSYKLSL